MAKLADLLGNSKKYDLFRVANNERVPYRGKKKHGSQMSNIEKSYIFDRLVNIRKWNMNAHALDRIVQKGIEATYEDITSTIHNATIIEYHLAKFENKKDVRIVLRSKAITNRHYNLNVVYSLTRNQIVSVWLNDLKDNHSTLDWNDYDSNLKIV